MGGQAPGTVPDASATANMANLLVHGGPKSEFGPQGAPDNAWGDVETLGSPWNDDGGMFELLGERDQEGFLEEVFPTG